MKTHIGWSLVVLVIIAFFNFPVLGQDEDVPTVDCTAEGLAEAIEAGTADILEANPDAVEDADPAYLFAIGNIQVQFALDCGYQPSFPEVETLIDRTLSIAPLSFIIAQSAIGSDVEVALAELEDIQGNSQAGQLLYNGLEVGLDGAELGCAGCHNGEAAPLTEGSWTRIVDIRLNEPEFADYTAEQYAIESIIHPANYIVPEYENVIMPANYGSRLDAQQLADLLAYLQSQDQVLDDSEAQADAGDETASTDVDPMATCSQDDVLGCTEIVAQLTGNDLRGEGLYNGTTLPAFGMALGCAGCHTAGVLGPATEGTWQRTIDERLTLSDFADYSVEQFVIEAIIHPNNYIPEGYTEGVMPGNYAEQLSAQDIADLLAFLRD